MKIQIIYRDEVLTPTSQDLANSLGLDEVEITRLKKPEVRENLDPQTGGGGGIDYLQFAFTTIFWGVVSNATYEILKNAYTKILEITKEEPNCRSRLEFYLQEKNLTVIFIIHNHSYSENAINTIPRVLETFRTIPEVISLGENITFYWWENNVWRIENSNYG